MVASIKITMTVAMGLIYGSHHTRRNSVVTSEVLKSFYTKVTVSGKTIRKDPFSGEQANKLTTTMLNGIHTVQSIYRPG